MLKKYTQISLGRMHTTQAALAGGVYIYIYLSILFIYIHNISVVLGPTGDGPGRAGPNI